METQPARLNEALEILARIQSQPAAQRSAEDRALTLLLKIKTGLIPAFI